MTDIVEEARAMLAESAKCSPYPWRVHAMGDRDVFDALDQDVAEAWKEEDAALIAAAPRLIAALADECERLREAMPTDEEIDAIRRQAECAGYVRNDRADMRDAKTIAPWLARLDAAKGVR